MTPQEMLANLLNENVGNKLTAALATGIFALFDQAMKQVEPQKPEPSAEALTS